MMSWYSAKSVEVPIELSDDCYCNLSVPIPNEQALSNITVNLKVTRVGTLTPVII